MRVILLQLRLHLLLIIVGGFVLYLVVIQGVPKVLAGMGDNPKKMQGLLIGLYLELSGKIQTHARTFASEDSTLRLPSCYRQPYSSKWMGSRYGRSGNYS